MEDRRFTLDMTMMYVMHDALRRDLTRIARIAARRDDDPRQVLRTAAGWTLFKRFLQVHHRAEDVAVWPVMQRRLADRPDDLALLDAMEAEHAAIDPMLAAIDGALADRDGGPQRLGDLVDELVTRLTGHLRHEESEALALIDATLTPQQWQRFGEEHRGRIGADSQRYLPWLLDEASPDRAAAVLGIMPEQLRQAYRDEWQPAYADLHPWPSDPSTAIGRD